MNPLEILRDNMDSHSFNKIEKLVAEGATWDYAQWTNEAALEAHEDEEGNRRYYVIVNFDEEDFETTPLFDNL